MNVYEAVKSTVTTRQAAEYYGIKVTGSGIQRQTLIWKESMKYRLKILKKSAKVEITTLKKIDLYDITYP